MLALSRPIARSARSPTSGPARRRSGPSRAPLGTAPSVGTVGADRDRQPPDGATDTTGLFGGVVEAVTLRRPVPLSGGQTSGAGESAVRAVLQLFPGSARLGIF